MRNSEKDRKHTQDIGIGWSGLNPVEGAGKRTFIPLLPGFVLKTLMGEFGSVPREGQKVLPRRLLDNMEDILMNLK